MPPPPPSFSAAAPCVASTMRPWRLRGRPFSLPPQGASPRVAVAGTSATGAQERVRGNSCCLFTFSSPCSPFVVGLALCLTAQPLQRRCAGAARHVLCNRSRRRWRIRRAPRAESKGQAAFQTRDPDEGLGFGKGCALRLAIGPCSPTLPSARLGDRPPTAHCPCCLSCSKIVVCLYSS